MPTLLVIPLAIAGVFVLAMAGLGNTDAARLTMRVEIELAKLLALLGCGIAATSFAPREYMRRAWAFQGASYALILTRDLLFATGLVGPRIHGWNSDYFNASILLAANTCGVIGSYMLARAWTQAGLALPGSRARNTAMVMTTVLISIAVAGPSAVIDVRAVMAGRTLSLVGLASDLGDLVGFCFIAPVFLTALALRGGLLVWPWALLTAGLMGWVGYDLVHAVSLAVFRGPEPHNVRVLAEVFRSLACTFTFIAGLSQRLVLRSSAAVAAAPPASLQSEG